MRRSGPFRVLVSAILAVPAVVLPGCDDFGLPDNSPHPEAAPHFAVAAYGDSLTMDFNATTWTADLPADWFRIVRKTSGERSVVGAERLRGDLDSGLLTSVEDVEVVVLMWGSNDGCTFQWIDAPDGVTAAEYLADQVANHGLDPAEAARRLEYSQTATDAGNSLVGVSLHARALGVGVVLVMPPPMDTQSLCGADLLNPRLERIRFALTIGAWAADIPFVDLYQSFGSHPSGLASLLQADGVHLNANGRVLAANLIRDAALPYHQAWLVEGAPLP